MWEIRKVKKGKKKLKTDNIYKRRERKTEEIKTGKEENKTKQRDKRKNVEREKMWIQKESV